MYANLDGVRCLPYPRAQGAECPTCGAPVIAKCGKINVWHWSHGAHPECDPWAEPDSLWHRTWQEAVPEERREVPFGRHRADLVTAQGVVVEVQHSGISVDEILEREAHYGRMAWIFDATEAVRTERLDIRTKKDNPDPLFRSFRWKHARRSLGACHKPVWLDLGDDRVLRLRKIYTAAPVGGWGQLYPRAALVEALNAPPT
ncbi:MULTISPECIES: competence protein CoiA family protein [unclassified Nocardioides]|jgi:competence protein CoiA|uniref:competence protein CoiA family protein n=1 Tax=unclassified Nocardioides TaxID=2615069 RepID=UPI000057058D|nr:MULTISPECIES: competence protein CoiA family protein [unclassified Nocardioides]